MATYQFGDGSEFTNAMLTMFENGSGDGTAIKPGDNPSYELCKQIYLSHPKGVQIVESPTTIAMSQRRIISIQDSPGDHVKEAFEREWESLKADQAIKNCKNLSRVYGVATMTTIVTDGSIPTSEPIPADKIPYIPISFSVFDPLNTAGSFSLNQDARSADFNKITVLSVAGEKYHFSRSCVVTNGMPIYLSYTKSAYGYVGRSIYQSILFPLKSYLTSMVAADSVLEKCGVIVNKRSGSGSIADKLSQAANAIKNTWIKLAKTGNVINIGTDESIETLNIQNVDHALTTARKNIIEDIASGAQMPIQLLGAEGYANGFGNGTEDFKQTVQFINSYRLEMQPMYEWMDNIVMRRAWSKEFYDRIQRLFPEYAEVSYEEAFYIWKNSFTATWPSLMEESDADKSDQDKVKLDTISAIAKQMLEFDIDPQNKAMVASWVADNITSCNTLFEFPMEFDADSYLQYLEQQSQQQMQSQPNPFGGGNPAEQGV